MFKQTLRLSGFVLLALFLLLPADQAQAASNAQESLAPLRRLLQADGSLNLNAGFSGSLDVAGWKMVATSQGAPRFVRSAKGGSTAPAPAAGDEKWSGQFGSQGTNGTVYALAVQGNDLYVGGYLTAAGGVPVNNIAKWSTATKSWSALGSGAKSTALALALQGERPLRGRLLYHGRGQALAVPCALDRTVTKG